MKIQVDPDLCEANGVCVRLAPDHFALDDDDRLHVRAVVDASPEQRKRIRDAVRSCPKGALRIIEPSSQENQP